jgi:hypothetical protein
MSISIQIDTGQLRRLMKASERAGKKFPRELSAAINTVAKKTQVKIGKDVRSKVEMSVAESKKPLKTKQKASAQSPKAIVSIAKTRRRASALQGTAGQDWRHVQDQQAGRTAEN